MLFRSIDTAGLNKDPKPLEKRGIEKSRERLAEADLILLVSEAGLGPENLGEELQQIARDPRSIVVLNKCDRVSTRELEGSWFGKSPLLLSAATGEGIDGLMAALVAKADSFQTEVGPDAVAISARHGQALREAVDALSAAREKVDAAASSELLSSDLRAALAAFGEITGRVDNERMLDQLFASFCIGK